MPRYDFRCHSCGDTFEVTRSISEADQPAPCPAGHPDTTRLLSMVALGGSAGTMAGAPAGGCCGGACGCG